ncbi:FunK1 protein kinase [Histoplasma capsulatum]|uniref:FunK1 protein kinase n=1 Tax=Ajellomyces capsulatus TaxID=5037 RepID=A0A8A1MDG8_AJECA|nr:FunK1 protein kinase [Histoplasma capsulatum]
MAVSPYRQLHTLLRGICTRPKDSKKATRAAVPTPRRFHRRPQAGHRFCERLQRQRGCQLPLVTDPGAGRAEERHLVRCPVKGMA